MRVNCLCRGHVRNVIDIMEPVTWVSLQSQLSQTISSLVEPQYIPCLELQGGGVVYASNAPDCLRGFSLLVLAASFSIAKIVC